MSKRKGGHSYSILQGKGKYCLVTGRTAGLDKHHIYHGPGIRDISDKHGFWCYLWKPLHIAGLGGLHSHPNSGLDLELKQRCQRKFEETHTREEFMEIIGRNYLDEAEEERIEEEKKKAREDGFFLI